MSKFGKVYVRVDEKLQKFEIFKDNVIHIDETNKKVKNYWLGLNQFADLSHEEFKKKFLGLKPNLSKRRESPEEFIYNDLENIPEYVDWRKKGAVTSVKNQVSCGKLPLLSLSL
ncbi:hypothetical protein P3X46_001888 [Hevea brasiliensis]|uniref:Cathepsin propeptide inhibitor domain-containing protein n=1 Tax=Hevea brasiliensis TaxID=3981 RepID=A0ABQ9N3P4_HEVBR|nr:hypothetical protein P3X46_001888 [Hevea brasiliensis]